MCRFNKGVCLSKKQKWAEEIILNLVDLFNSKSKDGTKRNDDRNEKQNNESRDSTKADKEGFKSSISKETGR